MPGYALACANERRADVCEKPRIKCSDCGNRLLIPLSDAIIYDHLADEYTIGVYPLLSDASCTHNNSKKIVNLHFQKAGTDLFECWATADNRIVYSIRVYAAVIRSVLG